MQYFMYTQPKNLLLYKRERERKYREKQNKETLLYKFGHTAAKRRLFIVNQSPRQLIHYIVSLINPFLPSRLSRNETSVFGRSLFFFFFLLFFFQNVYGAIESPVKCLDTQNSPSNETALTNQPFPFGCCIYVNQSTTCSLSGNSSAYCVYT